MELSSKLQTAQHNLQLVEEKLQEKQTEIDELNFKV